MQFSSKTSKIILVLALILVTRLIYTGVGIYARDTFLDKSKPFASWTYNHPNEAVNVWTAWDSGMYYWIAEWGYPKVIDNYFKTTISVPENTWVKVFLGYGEIGENRLRLPTSETEKVNNVLFLLGSETRETAIDLYGAYPGIPYCFYDGEINYERDVLPARDALTQGSACGTGPCDKSYVTYYLLEGQRVLYQEEFSKAQPDAPLQLAGSIRPDGFPERDYQGFGCKSVTQSDLLAVSSIDYKKDPSPFPFMPFYPYMTSFLNNTTRLDLVISGLLVSNIAFLISIFYFYKYLRLDFEEKTSFYAILVYILWPLAFLYSAYLTEAIFAALLFATLYYARTNKFIVSSILASLLAITRIPGVFIVIPLAYIYWKKLKGKELYYSLASLLTVPVILFAHLLNLKNLTGEWFSFLTAQEAFGRSSGGTLSSIVSYLLNSERFGDLEFGTFVAVLLVTIFMLPKIETVLGERLSAEYYIWTIIMFILPIVSGIFTSFPRYTLGIYPLFLCIAYIFRNKKSYLYACLVAFFLLNLVFMALWTISSRFIV